MPRATKICKACGKVYEACTTPNPYNVFRWFDVACSRECAEKYIHDVMVARGEIVDEPEAAVAEPDNQDDPMDAVRHTDETEAVEVEVKTTRRRSRKA